MKLYFPYKERISRHKDRYIKAYQLGLETIGDWLEAGPTSDYYTPSREALAHECISHSGINYWHFTDCCSDAITASLTVTTDPGDSIIVPAWSFIATAVNPRYIDRELIFCDVGTDGLIDINSLQEALERFPNTKCVMPVHLLGRVADVELLSKVIPLNTWIIEDCANAFYMNDGGAKPGYADISCYSFDLAKHPASTGTGGAVATNSHRLIDLVKEVTQQGFNKNRNGFVEIATKSSMDDTTARIIAEDIAIMTEERVRDTRRANNQLFEREVCKETLVGENNICTGFGFYAEHMTAREAKQKFANAGYEVTTYPCFPDLPAFNHCSSVDVSQARELSQKLVILPLHEYLEDEDKDILIKIANEV